MYRYDELDQALVDQRVAEFRDQVRRHLAGELTEDEFRPLRLRNGLYIQRHAPMLRIAIRTDCSPRTSCAPSLPLHAATTGATGTSPRGRTCSSTGPRLRMCPRSSPSSHACRCTPSRRAATVYATSPPTTSQASLPMRSTTRGPIAS